MHISAFEIIEFIYKMIYRQISKNICKKISKNFFKKIYKEIYMKFSHHIFNWIIRISTELLNLQLNI